jgi:hypothetical protein
MSVNRYQHRDLDKLSRDINGLRTPVPTGSTLCVGERCDRRVSFNAELGLCYRCLQVHRQRERLEKLGVVLPDTRLILPGGLVK